MIRSLNYPIDEVRRFLNQMPEVSQLDNHRFTYKSMKIMIESTDTALHHGAIPHHCLIILAGNLQDSATFYKSFVPFHQPTEYE